MQLASGEKMPCGIVVWSTGLAPRQFVRELDIPKNDRGQVIIYLCLTFVFLVLAGSFIVYIEFILVQLCSRLRQL